MARQLRDAQCHTIWEGTENILCIDVRRAMRGEPAHHALFGRIDAGARRARPATRCWPAPSTRWRRRAAEARAAVAHLEGVADDMALLHSSRRIAELLADTAEGALLVEEAAWALDRDGDARKAAVARRFAWRQLAPEPARGITDPDRTVLDLFEPLVRYGRIEPDQLPPEAYGSVPRDVPAAAQRGALEGVGRLVDPADDLGDPVQATLAGCARRHPGAWRRRWRTSCTPPGAAPRRRPTRRRPTPARGRHRRPARPVA